MNKPMNKANNKTIEYSDETASETVQADPMDKLIQRHGNKVIHSLNTSELIERDKTRNEHGLRDEKGLWQPGVSPNPSGRPKGVRNAVSEAFLRDLSTVWSKATANGSTTGLDVIQAVADTEPGKLLAAMVQVLPKDFQVNVTQDQDRWVINAQPGLTTQDWLESHSLTQPIDSEE